MTKVGVDTGRSLKCAYWLRDRADAFAEVALQGDIETLILCAGAISHDR